MEFGIFSFVDFLNRISDIRKYKSFLYLDKYLLIPNQFIFPAPANRRGAQQCVYAMFVDMLDVDTLLCASTM